MAAQAYVATGNIHHGGYKGDAYEEVWYERGDELDVAIWTETDIAVALQNGAIVPKRVWDALAAADVAREEARVAQLEAEAAVARLQHVAGVGEVRTAQLSEQASDVTKPAVEEEDVNSVVNEVKAGTAAATGSKVAAPAAKKG